MSNLIDRYVYDVTRRLPEKERSEVDKELRANVYDMLPEEAGEEEIKRVLYQLGSPARLAEQYRQDPRYLISPAVYGDYVRTLKWVLPLVGCIMLGLGVILGIVEAMGEGNWLRSDVIASVLSEGFSMGLSSAVQVLLWTTIGFVIADRAGAKESGGEKQWKVEELAEIPVEHKGGIPLSDCIVELALTVVFSVVAILACAGVLPVAFSLSDSNLQVLSVFSPEFLSACIPAIAVLGLFGVCEYGIKLKDRRWTPLVCCATIVSKLAGMCAVLVTVNRPDMFSQEFLAYVKGVQWSDFDLLRLFGQGGIGPVILVFSAVVVACTLAGCAWAVYKTLKARR